MIFLLILSTLLFTCSGQDFNSSSNELKIYNKLFSNYQKNVRPVRNDTTPTTVLIRIWFMDIINANPAQQSFDFAMDYGQTWKDEHLQWDPANYDGVDHIRVPEDLVWVPDVLLYCLSNRPLFPNEKRRAVISSDGNVSIYSPQTMTLNCQMKVDNFPYDNQKCIVQFVPWTYSKSQVIVKADPPPKIINGVKVYEEIEMNGEAHPEWTITTFKVFEVISNITLPNSGGQVVESINLSFEMELSRRPMYYLFVLALPTYIITSLCVLGIFSPFSSNGERQEKVSLGLTTMLAIAVMLNIVADQMPKSTTLPLLGYYVLAELFFCMGTTIISVVIMYMHQCAMTKQWPPPRWLQKLFQCKLIRKSNCVSSNSANNIYDLTENHKYSEDRQLLNAFMEHEKSLKAVNAWIEQMQEEKYFGDQWKELLTALDLLLLIVSQLANIIMSAIILIP